MPHNPHADFTPTLKGYSGQEPFRFWCQLALPLTYDDSLSYYELLNKVVNYLNHTIEDVSNMESNVGELHEAYVQLQNYVNDYFDNIDIEAELKNVLDKMALDGSLDALIDPLIANHVQNEVSDWLDENVNPVGSAVIVDSSLSISGAAADAKVTGDAVNNINTNLTNAIDALAPEFDASNAYAVGDYVIHNGKRFLCKKAKDAGDEWDYNVNWTYAEVYNREKLYDNLLLSDLLLEQGTFDTATGAEINNRYDRVRTVDYIYGNTTINLLDQKYCIKFIFYYNADTKIFDSYDGTSARTKNIGKPGCVARVVFANALDGNASIKPEELKRSIAMEKAIEEANGRIDNTNNIIAQEEFDASKSYAVGDYVLYNNNRFICTKAKNAGEAWDYNANWSYAEIYKREKLYDNLLISDLLLEQGTFNTSTGNESNNPNRVRTVDYIYGDTTINLLDKKYCIKLICYYNADTKIFDSYDDTSVRTKNIGKPGCVARVVFANALDGNAPIKPEELKRSIAIEKAIEEIKENISTTNDRIDTTNANLSTTNTNLSDAKNVMAAEYSNSNAYSVGDYVMRNGKRYICKRAKAAGDAWDLNINWYAADIDDREQLYDNLLISDLLLEQGTINTNGTYLDNNNRVRTSDYIFGKTKIVMTNSSYVVYAICYYNADTKEFIEYVSNNNSRIANIGRDNCVAKIVFANAVGTTPVKPEELKRSIAVENAIKQINDKYDNEIDKLNSPKIVSGNTLGTILFQFTMKKGHHYIFTNKSDGSMTINLFARVTSDGENIETIKRGLRTGSYFRYRPTDNFSFVYGFANDAYKLEIYEEETTLGKVLNNFNNAPVTSFDTDYTMYDYSNDIGDIVFYDEDNHHMMEQVYAKFDALALSYPDYITKVDIAEELNMQYPVYANGVSGSEIYADTPAYKTYMYKLVDASDYNEPAQLNTNIWANRNCPKKKLLLIAGTHGNEVYSVVNSYVFALNLAKNFLVNPNFFKLRTLFDVYIIPCLNGYGIYHRTRANANKVNINRNYPIIGWEEAGIDTIDDPALNVYTGPSPASEFETQLMVNVCNYIKPDVFIDHHNYGGESKTQFYMETANTYLSKTLYKSLIECAIAFKKEYPNNFGTQYSLPQSNDGSAPGWTSMWNVPKSMTWFEEQGIEPSAVVEMSAKINYQNGAYNPVQNSAVKDVFAVGEYTFRNVVMRMAEYLMNRS